MRTLVLALLFFAAAQPASAQLFEISNTSNSTGFGFSGGAAYDPLHDCYFVSATVREGGRDTLTGRFLNRSGAALGTVTIDTFVAPTDVQSAVTYSPDISDGAGGFGGFVVAWPSGGSMAAQGVAFPGRLIGSRATITGATFSGSNYPTKVAVAYSPVQRVFLMAVGTFSALGTVLVRFNVDLRPLGEMRIAEQTLGCSFEFPFSCNQVDVQWNPRSGDFGVLYNEGREKALARVLPSGTIASRTPLGLPPLYGALAVNVATGSYVAVSGGGGREVVGAEVSTNGVLLGRGVAITEIDTDLTNGATMSLSYSPASGTFLLLGRDPTSRVRAIELNQHGVALGTILLCCHQLGLAAHTTAAEWMVAAANNTALGTRTRFGGSDATLTGCVTPDPFTALGGGTCYNGGWLPPGIPVPTAPPTVPGGCVPPDPFVALGGGTCVNGGWLPPGIPPPLPPAPGGCTTPDPFVAIGGGVCIDGGWRPRGS
jgi:hypothetical protein